VNSACENLAESIAFMSATQDSAHLPFLPFCRLITDPFQLRRLAKQALQCTSPLFQLTK
jgi:hypothetical protein